MQKAIYVLCNPKVESVASNISQHEMTNGVGVLGVHSSKLR
jgi:hypothetical protein